MYLHSEPLSKTIKGVATNRKSANRAKGKPAERDLQIEIVSGGSGENVSPMMEAKAAVSGDGQEESENVEDRRSMSGER